MVVDGDGDFLIAGNTDGDLDGHRNGGRQDVFLMKFSSSGEWQWTQLHGGWLQTERILIKCCCLFALIFQFVWWLNWWVVIRFSRKLICLIELGFIKSGPLLGLLRRRIWILVQISTCDLTARHLNRIHGQLVLLTLIYRQKVWLVSPTNWHHVMLHNLLPLFVNFTAHFRNLILQINNVVFLFGQDLIHDLGGGIFKAYSKLILHHTRSF